MWYVVQVQLHRPYSRIQKISHIRQKKNEYKHSPKNRQVIILCAQHWCVTNISFIHI